MQWFRENKNTDIMWEKKITISSMFAFHHQMNNAILVEINSLDNDAVIIY